MADAKMNEKWKKDQLNYFQEYLKCFDEKSREHKLILEGIEKLKTSI